jgi:hypothetical protein
LLLSLSFSLSDDREARKTTRKHLIEPAKKDGVGVIDIDPDVEERNLSANMCKFRLEDKYSGRNLSGARENGSIANRVTKFKLTGVLLDVLPSVHVRLLTCD